MKKSISSNFNFRDPPFEREQWNIFQELISNLSDLQKIWFSGYLYGLVANSDQEFNSFSSIADTKNKFVSPRIKGTSSSHPIITILSASQTGNARELAKKFHQILLDEKFNVRLFSISDYNMKKIFQEKLLFLFISTYGEGDPPEEALTFHKYLFSKSAPNMKDIYFSVFGLGDRSYEHFSKAAKDFDFRFEELGGHRLLRRVDADLDYEKDVLNWCQEAIFLLKKEFMIYNLKNKIVNLNVASTLNKFNNSVVNNKHISYSEYTRENPFFASLLLRQKITSRNSVKDVYHLEIDLSGSEISYYPGDALGVWYENDPELVNELLQYFSFTGEEKINVHNQLLPLNTVLQKNYELTHNTALVAKKYAALIDNEELLSFFIDSNKLNFFVSSNSIIDMIRSWYPKKEISPMQLLSVLRPLTPRFYSVASSQQEVGEEVHITVGMVRYKVNNYVRTGGASGYLVDRLSEGSKLRVFIVHNESFRLPNDSNIAIIMIAAGTGIAPFRAFMQQRSTDGALGKNWLFFGNLSFLDDFLYQREWQKYVKDRLLTNIDTAWSRDQKYKIYVQDKIFEDGLEVWKWIENGAYIYVCGDAFRMAKSVEETLIQLGVKYGKMTVEDSGLFFEEMRVNYRYQRDVY